PRRAAGRGNEPRGLEGDVGAEPVVQRTRAEPAVRQLDRLRVDHRDVSDADRRARLLAVARADVDVHRLDLRDLRALVALQQVDRLLADDAFDRPPARVEHDPLADEDLGVPAADFPEPQEAVVVDVGDDQADLVDVTHHEQALGGPAGAFAAGDEGERGADRVGADLRERRGRLAPRRGRRRLIARRPPRLEQRAQDRRDRPGAGARGRFAFDARGRFAFGAGGRFAFGARGFAGGSFRLRAHAASNPRRTNWRM